MAVTGDAIFEIHEAQAVAEATPKALYRIRILPFENTSANSPSWIAQYGLVTFQFVNVEDYVGIHVIFKSFQRNKMKLIKPATSIETVQHDLARGLAKFPKLQVLLALCFSPSASKNVPRLHTP